MQDQIVEYIKVLANQNEVSQAKIADLLAETIIKIYNKQKPDQKIEVSIDVEKGQINAKLLFNVIADLPDGEYDDFVEIPLSEAKKSGDYKVGDICEVPFDVLSFFTKNEIILIMQIFKQRINEINNIRVYDKWLPRVGEIIYCMVEKHDVTKNFYIIDLGDGNMGFLSRSESIPTEELKPGQKYKFLVKEVKEQSKGWPIILSRADAQFVLKLLELETPEIGTGEITVNRIERIAGFKTKVAVSTTSGTYDACAIAVGPKGSRVKTVSEQIHGEKIEVINYSENQEEFLINACGAKNLVGYKFMPTIDGSEQTYVTLIVNEDVLPVIIGKKGFNIKLISKLVNCNIDINTVEEAKANNIDYKPVINRGHVSNPRFGHSNGSRPNAQNYTVRSKPVNTFASNENILNDIENLTQEELEARFNIKLKSDVEGEGTNGNDNNPTMSKLLEEMADQQEYEDLELSDAFADEIADVLNEKKK